MGIPILPLINSSEQTLSIIKPPQIIICNTTVMSEERLGLNQLFANLVRGGTAVENAFRAKEIYKELENKIANLSVIQSLGTEGEIRDFKKVLDDLKKLSKSNNTSEVPFNCTDAETLTKLILKLEALEEVSNERKENKAKIGSNLDMVLNGIADRIITILVNEAMARGSYVNLVVSVARLNPIWDVPDEYDLTQFLKKQVLTDEFRNCLKESIRGNKADTNKLNPAQKKLFHFSSYIVRLLCFMPEFLIKWLPRTGKVTKLSVNIIHQVPLIGPLITSFIGPIDEVINLIRVYGDQIKYIRKTAKEAREQSEKSIEKRNLL